MNFRSVVKLNMTTADIARTLLASPALVAARVLQEKLGQAGYTEAIRRCWIAGEPDTGLIQVTRRNDRLEAMRALAQTAPLGETVAVGVPGRTYFGEAAPTPINLVARPPEASPVAPPVGNPPNASTTPAGGANIGDQVTVAENGQTYSARIQAKEADGKFKLSFGGTRPGRDVYASNEIQVVGKPAAPKP